MSELPFLGVRPGMFEGAMRCPQCGFATSDPNVYECPNCSLVWKERPKKIGVEAGQRVALSCSLCGQEFDGSQPVVFAGATGALAHEGCLAGEPQSDAVVDTYLELVKNAQPIDGGAQYRTGITVPEVAPATSTTVPEERRPKRPKNTPCGCPPIIREGRQVGRQHQPPCPRGQ